MAQICGGECLWNQSDQSVLCRVGSNNFTMAGLGFRKTLNLEARIPVC